MAKEETMEEIYNEMSPKQQLCVAYYVNKAIESIEKKNNQNERSNEV